MLSQDGQFISKTSQPVRSEGKKNLRNETRFHVKISFCCLPDNESYDYRSHSKTNSQDTDLLTGFLLIKEEKKSH